jgi:hypothetical protein
MRQQGGRRRGSLHGAAPEPLTALIKTHIDNIIYIDCSVRIAVSPERKCAAESLTEGVVDRVASSPRILVIVSLLLL